jgi:hypothetical protein
MNGTRPRPAPPGVHQIANELCELYQEQIDALQRGAAEAEVEQYLERRKRIDELREGLEELRQGSSQS